MVTKASPEKGNTVGKFKTRKAEVARDRSRTFSSTVLCPQTLSKIQNLNLITREKICFIIWPLGKFEITESSFEFCEFSTTYAVEQKASLSQRALNTVRTANSRLWLCSLSPVRTVKLCVLDGPV
jgi:hypothetical protein